MYYSKSIVFYHLRYYLFSLFLYVSLSLFLSPYIQISLNKSDFLLPLFLYFSISFLYLFPFPLSLSLLKYLSKLLIYLAFKYF